MKVFVTGATGFTGTYVAKLLLQKGYLLRCLARPSSDRTHLPEAGIQWVIGDLGNFRAMQHGMKGVDVLVNIASIGFGHTDTIVKAALAAGVRRAVFISTTAIFTTLNAQSKEVRMAAEEIIRGSGLAYTILRPTMIYGNERDRNMSRLITFLRKFPIIPIAGDGQSLQQPVYVEDVARAVTDCIERATSVRGSYNIPGATALTFNEVVDTVCHFLGKRVKKVYLPTRPIVKILRLAEKIIPPLPVKAEQILRLNEDKTFGWEKARQDFGYCPRSFRQGIACELAELGLMGA